MLINVISKQTYLRLDEYEESCVYHVIFQKSVVWDVHSIIFLYDLDWMHNLNKLGVSSVKLKSLMVVKEWLPT